MTSKAERKALRKRGRDLVRAAESADWDQHMILAPAELRALLDHLDGELPRHGCDHSLRLTFGWADRSGKDRDALQESLAHFGGMCDCEVLANVDPETTVGTWARYRADA
jgi:Protein of unknown function (DUF2695)